MPPRHTCLSRVPTKTPAERSGGSVETCRRYRPHWTVPCQRHLPGDGAMYRGLSDNGTVVVVKEPRNAVLTTLAVPMSQLARIASGANSRQSASGLPALPCCRDDVEVAPVGTAVLAVARGICSGEGLARCP